ncbi:MAG: aromatic ring-hydroxylating dioxygenase subunit alpha [Deltaproteobacteria bacterium]|nr:aromatic ring-hydroxylating dioxygenase subunit alpha [Deltaproteobacteria bacterium]
MTSLVKLDRPKTEVSLKSVVHHKRAWYVVATSKDLQKAARKKRPLQVQLYGQPLVVFRQNDGVAALLDRCPHRGVPLSKGNIREGRISCGYHGWEFDDEGECQHIPCLQGSPKAKARRVPAFAAQEKDGYVWVFGEAGGKPDEKPFSFPLLDDDKYSIIRADVVMDGSLQQVAENALDVPHTAYLHGGLFRKEGAGNKIDVVIRRNSERCEAEYIGEPSPKGIIGKILAPGGGVVEHFDRFLLPCISQVEYSLGKKSHILVTAALTPIDDFRTRLFGCVALRLPVPLPLSLLGEMLKPLAMSILQQDARMLKLQTETAQAFGEETQISTDIDCLGPHILRLLKDAADGKAEREEEVVKRFSMVV